tara:strand:- start:2505 stop:2933 length:429 start_codon:yes stop_codon:yes gene_type:complete
MAYKSKYTPVNKEKYSGNVSNIICRSTWERKMCKYLDLNENVRQWASEELKIPYYSPIDKKWHNYFPDFICEIQDKKKEVKTYLIEVKPKKQTKEPKKRKSKVYLREMAIFTINNCKWEAAKKFCKEQGWTFKILTEDNLFK